jgi:hypothetical protein
MFKEGREFRYCPNRHVKYEVMPYTFSNTILNSEKKYCPVCGERLKVEYLEDHTSEWFSKANEKNKNN